MTFGWASLRSSAWALRGAAGLQVVPGAPPAHEPQSNGMIENGVKQVKGMIRTLMLALDGRIQGDIPVHHPVMLWLVEHAAELITKHLVGHDGKSACARLSGKPCRGEGMSSAKRVHFQRGAAGPEALMPVGRRASGLGALGRSLPHRGHRPR